MPFLFDTRSEEPLTTPEGLRVAVAVAKNEEPFLEQETEQAEQPEEQGQQEEKFSRQTWNDQIIRILSEPEFGDYLEKTRDMGEHFIVHSCGDNYKKATKGFVIFTNMSRIASPYHSSYPESWRDGEYFMEQDTGWSPLVRKSGKPITGGKSSNGGEIKRMKKEMDREPLELLRKYLRMLL